MTFLYRSSSLEGVRMYSTSDKRRRFSFYFNSLSKATCSASILYFVRLIRSDTCLFPYDRELLYKYAEILFRDMAGYDIEDNS